MLVFVRHAERGDNQYPKQSSEIDYDPPITKESGPTIKQTAIQLIDVFKSNNIKTIKVVTSKFLRCLMTTERLISHFKEAGMEISQPKFVSNEITEYMRQDWFKTYPLNSLIFDSPHLNKYVTLDNWKQQKIETQHPCPENYVMFHNRIGKYKEKLVFPKEDECLLLVTHGFVVRELCWRMNQVPNYAAQIKYCGYAAFKQVGNSQILLRSRL